jgi:molybdopterin-guanine dinucleotide biosynthesis protein A
MTAGILLAGGESRRMGQDKAWLLLAGEPMLLHTLRALRAACAPVVVVGGPGQQLPTLPDGVLLARDERPGRGPLEGLAAGLARLTGADAEIAFLAACDQPLLRPALVQLLVEALGSADAAVPREGDHYHPLTAAYRIATAGPMARQLLGEGHQRPRLLLDRLRTVEVPVQELRAVDPDLLSLHNCNTPEDLAALREELEG